MISGKARLGWRQRCTEITADAVSPVRTLRLAVINLRCQCQHLHCDIRGAGLHLSLLVVLADSPLQELGDKNHD